MCLQRLKIFLSVLLVALFVSSPLFSEKSYTITETELNRLETNLKTLQEELTASQTELNEVRTQLQTASELLKKSEKERGSELLTGCVAGMVAGALVGGIIGGLMK